MTALPSPWRRVGESPLAPALLLLFFVTLVVLTINRFGTWIDESATIGIVAPNGYGEILRMVQYDAHPPLGYLVLKPWLQLFGSSLVASRAESAMFMVAALGVWFHFIKTRFSRCLALLALALLVTNPMILHYAVEGRMYAFGVLLTGITCTLATSTWRWRWVAYWPFAVAMLYTHYFLSFVVAGEFIYLLVARRERALTVVWIVLYGASIIAAFLPWLPHALHMTSAVVSNGFWIPPISPSTLPSYVLATFLHRIDGELQGIRLFPAAAYLFAWTAALVVARKAKGAPYALLWCVTATPILVLLLLSCKPFVPVFHPRYVVYGLPALITLIATGALGMKGRWRTGAIAILVAGQLAGLQNLRWRGYADQRGYYAMKEIARVLRKPIGGELPTVVSTSIFTFFDARATLAAEQHVVILLGTTPSTTSIPDAILANQPDWYVLSLADVHARHVWTVEDGGSAPLAVPETWKLEVTHVRGYARYRLYALPAP